MGGKAPRTLIGVLLALFLVPVFCFAGLIGGCFLMMFFPDSNGQVVDSLMGVAVSVVFISALVVSVLVARGLRFGNN